MFFLDGKIGRDVGSLLVAFSLYLGDDVQTQAAPVGDGGDVHRPNVRPGIHNVDAEWGFVQARDALVV